MMEEKYMMGIKIIDEQHQSLFDLIDLLKLEHTKVELIVIIQKLKKYAETHFKSEEEYFDNLKFKYSDTHKIAHNIFIQTIDFYFLNPDNLNLAKIRIFLTSWLTKHILIEDKKYLLESNITKF